MLYTIPVNVIKFKINHSRFFRNMEKSEYVLRVVLTGTFFSDNIFIFFCSLGQFFQFCKYYLIFFFFLLFLTNFFVIFALN